MQMMHCQIVYLPVCVYDLCDGGSNRSVEWLRDESSVSIYRADAVRELAVPLLENRTAWPEGMTKINIKKIDILEGVIRLLVLEA
uniref:Uncharacterized protein n=1 Tax=Salix viminalis TaxID=40686 RepID=A0A6N2MYR1_SALVM